ncbi:hypothetical protein BCR39DRAFT_50611 [Naematelia encephala]|uniref:Uncharacterized protein n=1 Tax=Naematelia encephala TaxID=71784 RepID=A0A1Y2AHZ4_9TREE|nr:hypothetical protein BCR39DRAFT_50611 [Naematelia encephala]
MQSLLKAKPRRKRRCDPASVSDGSTNQPWKSNSSPRTALISGNAAVPPSTPPSEFTTNLNSNGKRPASRPHMEAPNLHTHVHANTESPLQRAPYVEIDSSPGHNLIPTGSARGTITTANESSVSVEAGTSTNPAEFDELGSSIHASLNLLHARSILRSKLQAQIEEEQIQREVVQRQLRELADRQAALQLQLQRNKEESDALKAKLGKSVSDLLSRL